MEPEVMLENKKMKWKEIRRKYPLKFVLIGDVVEEKLPEGKSRITEGKVLEVSDDGQEIRQAYKKYKRDGINVLFSLPTTPEEFVIEDVPYRGIIR
jgi:hypothetical protein